MSAERSGVQITAADLGAASFAGRYGLSYAYMAGAMANGISSVEMVKQLAGQGFLGCFGAAGLPLHQVEDGLTQLQNEIPNTKSFAVNFIHSPQQPLMEQSLCELLLARRQRLVEASAFMEITLPLVQYRLSGLYRRQDGTICCPNQVIAKVSRSEVLEKFLSPAPEAMLRTLVAGGHLSVEQAQMAAEVPMACDVSAEADSGGHTDNRSLVVLLPQLMSVKERWQRRYPDQKIHVGAAGGIGTPAAATAAFAMGADYIVTGSINQSCVESGSSQAVREMLAVAQSTDVTMAPAADMFERGIKVQVLRRGTLFPMRAQRLFNLYRSYQSLEQIPAEEIKLLETECFKSSLEEAWAGVEEYFQARDPGQLQRAAEDPHHKMALLFRAYLGQSSHWANQGAESRRLDFQVWCGPAMGAFNEWAAGTPFADLANRRVAVVAQVLMNQTAAMINRSLQGWPVLQREGVTP